jgi:hypothetical protein
MIGLTASTAFMTLFGMVGSINLVMEYRSDFLIIEFHMLIAMVLTERVLHLRQFSLSKIRRHSKNTMTHLVI